MVGSKDHGPGVDARKWEITESIEAPEDSGLCANCHDRPVNPSLPEFMCLDCYLELEISNTCNIDGCPNSAETDREYMQLCEVHLINYIHDEYSKYRKEKSRLENKEQELEDKLTDVGINPTLSESEPNVVDGKARKLYDEWVRVQSTMSHNEVRKQRIKDAMKIVEQPFPEDFEVAF